MGMVGYLARTAAVSGNAEMGAAKHRVLHSQAQVVLVMWAMCHVVMSKRELADFGMLWVLCR